MMRKMNDGDHSGSGIMLRRVALIMAVLFFADMIFADEPVEGNPGWSGTDFSGAEIDFPDVLQGKPTAMIFWATWCPYCQHLCRTLAKYKGITVRTG